MLVVTHTSGWSYIQESLFPPISPSPLSLYLSVNISELYIVVLFTAGNNNRLWSLRKLTICRPRGIISHTSSHTRHLFLHKCTLSPSLSLSLAPSLSLSLSPSLPLSLPLSSYYHSSLPPPLPLIWDGFIDMPGTTTFSSVAYPVSGNAEYVTEVSYSTAVLFIHVYLHVHV